MKLNTIPVDVLLMAGLRPLKGRPSAASQIELLKAKPCKIGDKKGLG
jgi:hypothetical protein